MPGKGNGFSNAEVLGHRVGVATSGTLKLPPSISATQLLTESDAAKVHHFDGSSPVFQPSMLLQLVSEVIPA